MQALRERLARRYGGSIDAWLDALPAVLEELGGRWGVTWDAPIPRGSVSAVVRCRLADGRPAVLKLCPDRTRLAREARALAGWKTIHVPAVLAVDEALGALLIEAIAPGAALDESPGYPDLERIAALLRALHDGAPDIEYPPIAARVAALFDSGRKPYERRPGLAEWFAPERYERSRERALRLAAGAAPLVLLHGDLTPVNILDGGPECGLVAIDPAPCRGDPAFDVVDLLFWRADDTRTIIDRAVRLAPMLGVEADRLLDWCAVFAGMVALERAEMPDGSREGIEPLLALATR